MSPIFFAFFYLGLTIAPAIAEEEGGYVAPDIEKICAEVKDLKAPKEDQPTEKEKAELKKCDADALYFGIGREKDFKQARLCGFAGQDKQTLAMIYANGEGVKRNVLLAEHFVCEAEEGTSGPDVNKMFSSLEEIRKTGSGTYNVIDAYCNSGSGYGMGICAMHAGRVADGNRIKDLEKAQKGWTAAEKKDFETVQAALKVFAELASFKEVDLTGTMRGVFVHGVDQKLKAAFQDFLDKLEEKSVPKAAKEELAAADKRLNELYKNRLAELAKDKQKSGSITPEGLKESQRAWLKYRDAWLVFAKKKYPAVTAESLSAYLTKERNGQLETKFSEVY